MKPPSFLPFFHPETFLLSQKVSLVRLKIISSSTNQHQITADQTIQQHRTNFSAKQNRIRVLPALVGILADLQTNPRRSKKIPADVEVHDIHTKWNAQSQVPWKITTYPLDYGGY
jgi:hypothetical protein